MNPAAILRMVIWLAIAGFIVLMAARFTGKAAARAGVPG